jgi:hypothetical protein
MKSLRVGYTSSLIITQNESFVTYKSVVIGSSPSSIITSSPTTSRPYCLLIENIIEPNTVFVNKEEAENAVTINDETNIDVNDAEN